MAKKKTKPDKLRIESGHEALKNVAAVDGDSVRFVTPDGRTMFRVTALEDGRSIEVEGLEATYLIAKSGGIVRYCETLLIEPRVSNAVVIRTQEDT